MKKLISIMLALVFVFSMATVALADETQTPVYTDQGTVTIYKNYTSTNTDTESPEETFSFEVTKLAVTDAADSVTVDNMPVPTISNVSYEAGDAGSSDNAKKAITINLPTYTSVGVYTYEITEKAGTQAGVDYAEGKIFLKVTVVEENGLKRIVAVHVTDDNGAKLSGDSTAAFTNTYSAGTLKVTKTVTGNLGDKDKYFEFKVKLEGEAGKNTPTSFDVDSTSYTENPATIALGVETSFYLKHGETLSISNIPYGVSYSVTETAVEGYTTTKTGDSGTIDNAEKTAAFTNDKTTNVDTGISLDSVPFILILAVCAGAAILFVTKRRSVEF